MADKANIKGPVLLSLCGRFLSQMVIHKAFSYDEVIIYLNENLPVGLQVSI